VIGNRGAAGHRPKAVHAAASTVAATASVLLAAAAAVGLGACPAAAEAAGPAAVAVVQVPGEGEPGGGEVTSRGGEGDPPLGMFVASGAIALGAVGVLVLLRKRQQSILEPEQPEPPEPRPEPEPPEPPADDPG
jgi:hypothetical protein